MVLDGVCFAKTEDPASPSADLSLVGEFGYRIRLFGGVVAGGVTVAINAAITTADLPTGWAKVNAVFARSVAAVSGAQVTP